MIHDVLGMGLEQFAKVVLLPQGDFAAFLRASPEQRREVLERLFDTQRFTDIEQWLADRRRAAVAAVADARAELAVALVRVQDVLRRPPRDRGLRRGRRRDDGRSPATERRGNRSRHRRRRQRSAGLAALERAAQHRPPCRGRAGAQPGRRPRR